MELMARQLVQLGAHWVEHLYGLLTQVGRQFGWREIDEHALE